MANDAFNIQAQEFYYHVSPIQLEVGSVIKKGNWGRVIRLYMGGDFYGLNLFRERVFEDIRLQNFPDKPSRLNSNYLLINEDSARKYLWIENGANRKSLIYKVRVCNEQAKSHLGNFNKVTVQAPLTHFDHMDNVARDYWSGVGLHDVTPFQEPFTNNFIPITTIELLVESDIEIVERL